MARALARRAAVLGVALLTLAAPRAAEAWSRPGHMIHGAITYQDLKQRDSVALGRTIALLKAHPDYGTEWLPLITKEGMEQHDIMLFMLAARWPDDVRDRPEYHHSTWHYTNFSFVPPGDATKAPVNAGGDVMVEIEHNFAVLRDAQAADSSKAIALAWIFHLVGDIHQPLHVVNIFSAKWPEGDRGGNLFWVRATADARPINLHAFWDGLISGSDDVRGATNRAIALRAARPRDQVGALVDRLAVAQWTREEGIPIGIRWAYLDGRLAGGTSRETAEVLPAGYLADAKRVGEAQVTLAGYRLSALLARSLGAAH